MKTVLVTGGAGYVGSHACKALAAQGYLPVTYDNLVRGHLECVRWGPFEHGDINDRIRLDQVLEKHRPHAIMHFAAYAYVGESVADPAMYYRNNATGSLSLLEATRDHHIRHFIYSSSCTTYGEPAVLPINENTPQNPVNPYGMSKLVVERMTKDFAYAHGLSWIALRYFNAAGADPDGETGETSGPEPRIIPRAIMAAEGEAGPLRKIFGNDYDTPDGTCIRDYVHVTDLARAHVLALEALKGGLESQAFNLGTGIGHSVSEIVAAVERVTRKRVPVEFGPRRAGDPAALVADPARANSILGWTPTFRTLDDCVRTAWKWEFRRPA